MAEEKKDIAKLRFVYQKARHHRTLHADGVWASGTTQLEVQFALFNNLKPMPDDVVHLIHRDGTLGQEIDPQVPEWIIREVDVTVVMNREIMRATIDLFSRMLREIDEHI